ncbi:MAG: 16S rRNA (uracil(1498)-N(3))-methyltransferase [Lactobacillaceae bacterium]|jgi:16S rRNA (uracil1498-N3)-methyltransferase|nr:16S rRNA (uracil(1498)-N(3))-methyltransferase [Lactobacillaceae bacterium]
MQRYFLIEMPNESRFELDEETKHHLMNVLRGQVGTKAEFVTPEQTLLIAEVAEINAEQVWMKVIEEQTVAVELPVAATLVLGLAKGDKPELVVQKATELGATAFIFVETEFSVAHWGSKAERKLERLRKIARGAAEQSHRLKIPSIEYAERLNELQLPDESVKVVAWEESAKADERANLVTALTDAQNVREIVFLIGPEGGLSKNELQYLTEELGFMAAGFGPRILRAETAPLYAMSVLSYVTELDQR